jgi:hypothetical protein
LRKQARQKKKLQRRSSRKTRSAQTLIVKNVKQKKRVSWGLQAQFAADWEMYLGHWEKLHIPEEEQGAGGGRDIVETTVDGMDNLAVDDDLATYEAVARASQEFFTNCEVVGQAEDA